MKSYRMSEVVFNYNDDFSGNIIITNNYGDSIEVPGEELLQFVAMAHVLPRKMEELEEKSVDEILFSK